MGVIGLTPFLLKAFPQVIKSVPERAKALAGKTLVFDGTLITQRFHFANSPHPYRHVIGWFTVVRELREAGVHAICVFDGNQRNAAKGAETQRRREARNVDSARAHIETQRYHRLRDLHQLLAEAQTLSTQERNQLLDAFTLSVGNPAVLDDVISTMGHEDISSSQGLYSGSSERASRDGVSASGRSRAATWRHPETKSFDTVTNDDIEYILRHELPTGTSKAPIANEKDYGTPSGSLLPSIGFPEDRHEESTLTPGLSTLGSLAEALQGLSLKSKEKGAGQLTSVINTAPLTAGTLIAAFSQLFVKFQNSVPEVAASAAEVEEQALSAQPAEDTSTIKNQYSISKYQEALTVAEAKIWKELSQLDVDIAYADLQVQVVSLLEQSQTMTESYDRRTNPPTAKTYQECQEILGALGIPIIIPNGPYEAEALAATLVVRGHADYVVSEDTDVLVYEAPLIRNFTNKVGPLQIISGAEVRSCLGLERESYVDFNLLLGTDFSQRLKNVGPARAFKFISEHKSIERVLETETQYPPRTSQDIYLEQVATARTVFNTFPPLPEPLDLQFKQPDVNRVEQILRKYSVHQRDYSWENPKSLGDGYFGDNPSLMEGDFAFEPFR